MLTGRVDIREIRAALSVVRENEALLLRLRVSMHSASSGHDLMAAGLQSYLRTTKTHLRIQLVVGCVKVVCGRLSQATVGLFRVAWSRITGMSKSVY